jgi:uncharacterized protein GlcG (DUF336 family)
VERQRGVAGRYRGRQLSVQSIIGAIGVSGGSGSQDDAVAAAGAAAVAI